MEPGGGVPGWFVAWGVLVVVVGIIGAVWRMSTAQKLAKRSGMDPGLATQITLLSDDGLDATYLASSLRGQATPSPTEPATPMTPPRTTADRLEELKALLDGGLVTQAEYDARRQAIIDSV